MGDGRPSVSVIIPVYNDAAALARCLAALARQTYPADGQEVLVVDNGSTQDIGDVVLGHLPAARLLHEPRPGSYAARNRAMAEATGDILAFTDADCLPQPDWLERGVAALQADPSLGLVAGRIELFAADAEHPTGAELYDMAFALDQEDHLTRDHFGATANLFTRLAVVRVVGPFDAKLRSRGDFEWGRRVWKAGYAQAYAADAVVRHPARRSLREMVGKARRIRGGQVDGELDLSASASARRLWRTLGWFPWARGLPMARRLGRRYGTWRATRFFGAMYLRQLVAEAEELRIRLGGTSRR